MTLEKLISEGERLAKPSLLLSPEPNDQPVVAYWGGQRRTEHSSRGDDRHKLTVDCAWLNAVGIDVTGSIGVFEITTHRRRDANIHIEYQPRVSLAEISCPGGQPLYGYEHPSLPPLQALCLYGGDAVAAWLAECGWTRTDSDAAESSSLGRSYQDHWVKNSPFYSAKYAAVLHGWHQQWPEDDFYMPEEMKLLIWTFWESEPWLEVRWQNPNFRVDARIT